MHKQAPVVEWYLAESDGDWERLCAPPLPDSAPAVAPATSGLLSSPRFLGSVAAILLLLVGTGGWWWRTHQAALSPPATSRMATAQPADEVVAPGRDAVVVSLPGDQAVWAGDQTAADWQRQFAQDASGLRAAIETNAPSAHLDMAASTVEFWGEQALVHIVTSAQRGAPAYRQTRFYQRTAAGWQQTPPDAALWGPARSLETLFVTFHFRQQDAPAVMAVAAQVNNLYTTLRRNLGLPRKAWEEKLVIDVSVTQPPGAATPWFGVHDPIRVPSPAVYLAPVELTDAELLAQSIALPLLEQVLAQAREHHAIGLAWQPLLDGLRLWQVWDLDLPLAAWQAEVVRWIYADEPAIPPGQPVVLPDHYEALCAAHTLWMPSPIQLGIPLICTELDGKHWYFASLVQVRDSRTHLDQLILSMSPDEYVGQANSSYGSHPGQTVALAVLIEYAVATYGRERLPALVAGLGQYDSWETLLPAVYGVSTAEFEAGWQAYLATH